MRDLLSTQSRVETPFIIATIAGISFGIYEQASRDVIYNNVGFQSVKATYPNFMENLVVEKINGTVNTYTLTMVYAVKAGDDPNFLEKVFSKAQKDRKIILSYGDLATPNYIYKNEEAIITRVTSRVDIRSSVITYTLNCTSTSLALAAGNFSFEAITAKPSDEILRILYDQRYGMLDIFYGMRDKNLVLNQGLIARDDKPVLIEAQRYVSVFEYISYLVSCMINVSDTDNDVIKSSKYVLTVVDQTNNVFDGPYFKIVRVSDETSEINNPDLYSIDIGYPGQNIVTDFSIDDNETYSILYDYSGEIDQSNFIYRIDNEGNVISHYSPTISNSDYLMKTTTADKTWWTQMTQYPITATVTIKGLLKPIILMTVLKLNVLFYGRKHLATGYYIVTKQIDTIGRSGYRTQLKLTRIKGE